ncbi:MAG: para-aminobenzoate synthetase component 1, partial [Planctomycetota bacterium]
MSYRFEPRVFPVAVPCLRSLLHALRDEVGLAVLDSAAGVPQRFSIVAIDPLGGPRRWNSLASLRTSIEAVHAVEGDELPEAFGGGFLGALSYELGACDEPLTLPDPAWKTPRIVGGLYVDYLCIDHQSGQAQLVLAENPGDDRAPLGQRRERWLSALARRSPLRAGSIRSAGPLVSHVPASEHERRIEEARACIAAGEIYQVNLARRYTRAVDAHPVDLFLRLRELNSAPFMAYLQWSLQDEEGEHQGALMSASPELLLEFDAGEALTRPIKGTIARQADPEGDRAARQRLLASDKERAELAMIVDLERNDLGRVAQPGGVRVGDFPRL